MFMDAIDFRLMRCDLVSCFVEYDKSGARGPLVNCPDIPAALSTTKPLFPFMHVSLFTDRHSFDALG
jgi:hypothetical protein